VGGVFCATDGFIRPMRILEGYAAAATRLGARFDYGTDVRTIRVRDGRVTAVESDAGVVRCGAVVNAAGAWAAAIARTAGVELPVTPVRRQVATTGPCALLPGDMPMTVFTDDGFHLRVRDGHVLLLWPGPAEAWEDGEVRFDEGWLP